MNKLRERWQIYKSICRGFVSHFCKDRSRDRAYEKEKRLFEKIEATLRGPTGDLTASDEELDEQLHRIVVAECLAIFEESAPQQIVALRSKFARKGIELNSNDAEYLRADTIAHLYKQFCDKHYSIQSSLHGLFSTTALHLYLDDARRREPLYQHKEITLDDQQVAALPDPHLEATSEQLLWLDAIERLLERIPNVEGGGVRKQWLLRLRLLEERSYKEIAALDRLANQLVAEQRISEQDAIAAVMSQEPAMVQRVKALAAVIDDGTIRVTLDRARHLLLLAYDPGELREVLEQHKQLKEHMEGCIKKLSETKWKTPDEAKMVRMYVLEGKDIGEVVTRICHASSLKLSQDEWRSKLRKCLKQLFQAFILGREEQG
jgi:hypothetical protein